MSSISTLFTCLFILFFSHLTSISFATPITQNQSLDKIIAVVNDEPITEKEYFHQLEYTKMKYKQQNLPMPNEKSLQHEALDALININLQLQFAKQNQLTVSDQELKQALDNIAAQHQLTYDQLREAVVSQGQTFANYQNEIRQNILLSKLQQQIVVPAPVTDNEINDYISKHPQSQNLFYHIHDLKITIPESSSSDDTIIEKVKIFTEQLLHEAKNGATFKSLAEKYEFSEFSVSLSDMEPKYLNDFPEIFAQQIQTMRVKDISDPIKTPNGYHLLQLVATKHSQADNYISQVFIRHILIKPDVFSGSFNEALAEAKRILQRLRAGEPFSKLAKLYSHDTKSAAAEGSLGWVDPKEFPLAVAQAIEQLKMNQISEPIKSPFGLHIIQVQKRRQIDASVEIERKQIYQLLQQQKMEKQIQKWLIKLREQSYVKILDKRFAH